MATLKEQIIEILKIEDGFTDREITDKIKGYGEQQQSINIACRDMAKSGVIKREARADGLIGNYYLNSSKNNFIMRVNEKSEKMEGLSEENIKEILNDFLILNGWKTQVAWGKTHGIDIDALKERKRWIIEVKGCGSRDAMRVNYFLAILGETLQRMDDPNAKYSIALPDIKQYRNLWSKLPSLAKERTGISILFVKENKEIEEVN